MKNIRLPNVVRFVLFYLGIIALVFGAMLFMPLAMVAEAWEDWKRTEG